MRHCNKKISALVISERVILSNGAHGIACVVSIIYSGARQTYNSRLAEYLDTNFSYIDFGIGFSNVIKILVCDYNGLSGRRFSFCLKLN